MLTLTVKVVNVNNNCAAVAAADVEIWQCDAAGDYSQYSSQTAATFLRGIQTDQGHADRLPGLGEQCGPHQRRLVPLEGF